MSEKSTEQRLREALQALAEPHGTYALSDEGWYHDALALAREALALSNSGDHALDAMPEAPVELTEERVEELARDFHAARKAVWGGLKSWDQLKSQVQEENRKMIRYLLAQHPEMVRAEVSPSVAAQAVDDLRCVTKVLHDLETGMIWWITPETARELEDRLCAIQKTLREIRDGAPEAPAASAGPSVAAQAVQDLTSIPRSEYEVVTGGSTGTLNGPLIRSVDGTKSDPLADVQRMLDERIANCELSAKALRRQIKTEMATGMPSGSAAASAISLTQQLVARSVYAGFRLQIAALGQETQKEKTEDV